LTKPKHISLFITKKNFLSGCVLLVVILVGINFNTFGQQPLTALEDERVHLEKEIEYTGALLNKTARSKQATLSDLAILRASIESRQQLISNYQKEQKWLYDTIFLKIIHIDHLQNELNILKEEYAKMIRSAYRQQNTGRYFLYLLASESFQQAFRRMNYIRAYAAHRNEHLTAIHQTESAYLAQVAELEQRIESNVQMIDRLTSEHLQLSKDVELKNSLVAELSNMEKQLRAKISRLQENHEHLKTKIEQTIAADARNYDISGDTTPVSEEHQLAMKFQSNWGKLPWPSEPGIVSSRFGEHEHPDLKGIKVRNNGINIITGKGAKARAVFEGVVTRVMHVSNFNQVVILRHGMYLTVYSNLQKVTVEKGDRVTMKQELGTIFTDAESEITELHFELWKGKEQLDPMQWLSERTEAMHVNSGASRKTTID
jgi:murein hydrolase activator